MSERKRGQRPGSAFADPVAPQPLPRRLEFGRRAARAQRRRPRRVRLCGGRVRRSAEASGMEIRVRQPCHHESVLRADAIRHRRRLRRSWLQLSVDRVGDVGRIPDGERHGYGDHREGGRHRDRAGRLACLQRAHQTGARSWHPGVLLQRGRKGQRPTGLHRSGPVRLRPGARSPYCRPGEGGPRRRLHRDAGPAQHPAAARRRQGRHQGVGQRNRARARSQPARPSTRRSRGSTPITSDTKTSRACSPSMREARWR